jgi:hypothetical protein
MTDMLSCQGLSWALNWILTGLQLDYDYFELPGVSTDTNWIFNWITTGLQLDYDQYELPGVGTDMNWINNWI